MFEKVICYIRKIDPAYTYDENDFEIRENHERTYVSQWNIKEISRPTEEQLTQITPEECQMSMQKIKLETEEKEPQNQIKELKIEIEKLKDLINNLIQYK